MLATVIGEVTDGDRLTVDWHGERIVDVPPRTVAHEGPVYERPMARPADLDALQADDAGAAAPADAPARSCRRTGCAVVSSPDGADKTWVTEQYDRYVRGNTVLAQPEDAGVVRIDEESPPRHRARRWTATPATPGSTRTPARSSTWPRPTATSPSPARRRSPSPTA